MMTHQDYEEQKRRLVEQHWALQAMVGSAFETQLRALDMVWRMMSGEGPGPEIPVPAPPPPPAAPPQPAGVPPLTRRLRAGELREDIEAAFPRIPETFTYTDVCEAIGYAPDRGSVHRVLLELKLEGRLELAKRGTGVSPSRYRQLRGATEGSGP
jgi:hypothetical protein